MQCFGRGAVSFGFSNLLFVLFLVVSGSEEHGSYSQSIAFIYSTNASNAFLQPPNLLLNVSIEYLQIPDLVISVEVGCRPNNRHIRSISSKHSCSVILSLLNPVDSNPAFISAIFHFPNLLKMFAAEYFPYFLYSSYETVLKFRLFATRYKSR